MIKLAIILDHLNFQDKNEKIRLVAVDYFEFFLCAVDNNNKVILYNLKTLIKLFVLDLKHLLLDPIDELHFGKLS
jgi:hypothetical protein